MTFTAAEKTEFVAAHNAVRQRVAQAESQRLGRTVTIPDVVWDDSIATVSQEWADFLSQQSPPDLNHRTDLGSRGLGENLYTASAQPDLPDQSWGSAVESWAGEQQWYDYDGNSCAAPDGQSCGHYTQLVWAETQRVGGGRANVTTDDGWNTVIFVCNYGPAGNFDGQPPYR